MKICINNLEEGTVAELIEYCRGKGYTGYSKPRNEGKKALINWIYERYALECQKEQDQRDIDQALALVSDDDIEGVGKAEAKSIDTSQCLKIGGKVKIHCNDPFIDGQQGVLLDVGDKGIARVQLNDGEYISSVASLTSVTDGDDDIKHLVNKLSTGEATKENLLNILNALLVEIHLAAHKISPGIGESAVLASATTLLDFLRNDKKKIDFAARYAANLGTDTSEIDEYLEKASFTKTRCRFGPQELPSFQFEKIQNIQHIEDSLDPQEIHLVVLAKCETLYFCGYANLLTQKAFLACGEELAISLKFANLKILTKGETVREAFERR